MYIGELTEQSLTFNYNNENGDVIVGNANGKLEDYQEYPHNQTTVHFAAFTFGPLYRTKTYDPNITIITQLPYIEKDGSTKIFPHITETCFGRSFTATEWRCVDGEETIPVDKVCDNPQAPDCADGSDEARHLCTGGSNGLVIISLVAYFLAGVTAISLGKY